MSNIYLPWRIVETKSGVMIKSSEPGNDKSLEGCRTVCYFPISGTRRRAEQRAVAAMIIHAVQAHADGINFAVALAAHNQSFLKKIKGLFS